eukprot:TRINITY_DN61144_c0_g1_i1.p1 TRINITY_DN61144_c0_g1~~TRINITY_DN61144_c0_g1_i1.p1  ORF type:complete len:334 (+),score=59.65 TRINITY_DN61144_c0_g1_i1:141-1004(+)
MLVCMSVSVSPLLRVLLLYCGAVNGASKKTVTSLENSSQEIIQRGADTFIFRSMFEGEDALREVAQEEVDRRKQEIATEQQELRAYCRMSTLRSERKNRLTTATRHSAAIIFSHAISSAICWFSLRILAPEVLAQAGCAYLITGLLLPGLAELVLPILLLHGLSPTRVWWHSLCLLFGGMTGFIKVGAGAKYPEMRSSDDDDLEVMLACRIVGWPFSWLVTAWLRYKEQWRAAAAACCRCYQPLLAAVACRCRLLPLLRSVALHVFGCLLVCMCAVFIVVQMRSSTS